MKANEILKKYDICRSTLWRWVKSGKIIYIKLPSGRYDYIIKSDLPVTKGKTVIYARCSTSNQKENLVRQINRLKTFASANGYCVDHVYSEIASTLNYNRKEYRKLYKEIISKNIEKIIIEYKDRLLRIGFDDFSELCNLHNVDLIIIDNTEDKSKNQEIIDNMVEIVNDLSLNIFSNKKRKKIINTIIDSNNIED